MHPIVSRSIPRALAALAFLAWVLLAPAAARAGGVLDQTSPVPVDNTSATFYTNASNQTWQAQIKAGLSGQLAGITMTLNGAVGSSATFRVRDGAAPSTQPALFQQLVTQTAPANQALFIDMTASDIMLNAGDLFVLEIQGTSGGLQFAGSYIAPPGTPLYSQPVYLDGAIFSPGWQIGFMTYVQTCTVGAACDDGDPCTQNDVCNTSSVCAGTPVACNPADACHTAGTCDPSTGTCSTPAVADGTECNDGNACTKTDTCLAGVCTGMNPVICANPPTCQAPGPCDKTTGICAYTPDPDGTACVGGECSAGTCVPSMMGTGGAGTGDAGTGDAGTGGAGAGGGAAASSSAGTGGSSMAGTGGSVTGVGGAGTGAGGTTGTPQPKSGCGCRTAADPDSGAPLAMLLGLGAIVARRRQRSAAA